jgi:hypothetical protein
MKLFYKSLLL